MRPKIIKRKRSAPKPKPTALATTKSEPLAAVPTSVEAVPASPKSREVSEAAKQAFKNWMKEAFGTADAALQDRLFDQSIGAVPDFVGNEHKTMAGTRNRRRPYHDSACFRCDRQEDCS